MQTSRLQHDKLQQYFIIKKTAYLPPKINIIFSILERAIQVPLECQNSKQPNRAFLNAFSKLQIDEQARFMNQNIKYVVKYLCKKQNQIVPKFSDIKHIETTAQVYSTMFKIPIWTQFNFRLDQSKKHIILSNKKKTQTIDLYNYLVRKSKKFKGSIVLEGIDKNSKHQMKKYTIFFKQQIGQEIYQQLFKTVIYIKQVELQQILKNEQQTKNNSYSGEKNNMAFLSSKNINEFLNYKDTIIKYLLTAKFDFKQISVAVDKPYKIYQSQKTQKIFKLQADLQIQMKLAKQNFIKNFGNKKNKMIVSSQILQSFSSKYQAVYEKYLFANKNKLQQIITIREQNLLQGEDTVFVKGIDLLMKKNFLQFLTVKIKPIQQNSSKLIIVASIILNQYINSDNVKLYLYTLYENTTLKKSQQLIQSNSLKSIQQQDEQKMKDQFRTVFGNINDKNQQVVQFVQADQQDKGVDQFMDIIQESGHKIQINYLNHYFKMEPIQGYNKEENIMKQHYLWTDWVRRKQGGVICNNQQIVNTQKKLFKQLLSRMGNKILKGQTNVLNISIPVIVFKKQSHLQSIARDFCYAPFFLQNKTDSLQRVKYATLLAISVGNLGISMQKPFNPLLGQTLQAWIGGCPIYLQQISHHPPIGAYYMLGRGYKIYGQIQPKISLGMNNAKGYSQRPNYIVFDDGTQIQMVYGKMVIHGLIFGERQFNYQDQIYVYDKTHHIFSQIIYGPRRKGLLSKSSQPWDFCYGKIYQLKQEFKSKFQNSHPKILPSKAYIIKELSTFQGVWNESIAFDGVQYCNFRTFLPCAVEAEQYPLLSHSKYRKDLIRLIQGNIQEAQKQKQMIEQVQRRDRKLRQKYQSQKIKSQKSIGGSLKKAQSSFN